MKVTSRYQWTVFCTVQCPRAQAAISAAVRGLVLAVVPPVLRVGSREVCEQLGPGDVAVPGRLGGLAHVVQDAQRPVAGDRALAARSSGDGLSPKRPDLLPYEGPAA
ncbi:hypothetical protein OG824_39555 [Streptomyces prunicolor]|nr:hypothetical protein [Streptomyces prunicolor]